MIHDATTAEYCPRYYKGTSKSYDDFLYMGVFKMFECLNIKVRTTRHIKKLV
jgi:hypothetical protein